MSRDKNQKAWAEAVKARDKKCVFCGSIEKLHAHHLLKYETFIEHRADLANGITVCQTCHLRIHTMGGQYGKKRIG